MTNVTCQWDELTRGASRGSWIMFCVASQLHGQVALPLGLPRTHVVPRQVPVLTYGMPVRLGESYP